LGTKIVAKAQRRFGRVDDLVISPAANGLITGKVQAHLAEVYGTQVCGETISVISGWVLDELDEWQSGPPTG
jgi:transposase-like protein